MSKFIGYNVVLVLAVFAATYLQDAIASPAPSRGENMALGAKVFAQPEYVEALAKELEKQDAEHPVGAMWWHRYQQSRPTYPSSNYGGNLDHIGGGNLLRRRNLDQIGGGNLIKRNLDQIGGGNLLRSLPEYYDD